MQKNETEKKRVFNVRGKDKPRVVFHKLICLKTMLDTCKFELQKNGSINLICKNNNKDDIEKTLNFNLTIKEILQGDKPCVGEEK
jgi:hypothetical protein